MASVPTVASPPKTHGNMRRGRGPVSRVSGEAMISRRRAAAAFPSDRAPEGKAITSPGTSVGWDSKAWDGTSVGWVSCGCLGKGWPKSAAGTGGVGITGGGGSMRGAVSSVGATGSANPCASSEEGGAATGAATGAAAGASTGSGVTEASSVWGAWAGSISWAHPAQSSWGFLPPNVSQAAQGSAAYTASNSFRSRAFFQRLRPSRHAHQIIWICKEIDRSSLSDFPARHCSSSTPKDCLHDLIPREARQRPWNPLDPGS